MIKCNNLTCYYYSKDVPENGNCILEEVSLKASSNGARCDGFKKGFWYYFLYWVSHTKSNFVCMIDFNDDYRNSIYYMMKCLPIAFTVDPYRDILILKNTITDEILNEDGFWDLYNNHLDNDELHKAMDEFLDKGVPTEWDENVKKKKELEEKEPKEFGWVSPMGDFIESPWGTHEKSAFEIIEKLGVEDEFENSDFDLARDFISIEKGYCLIDDPTGCMGYNVTYHKPLTKKQRDFLYGYFIDMGMTARAELYLEDD